MNEYLISLNEKCADDEIWNVIKIIKPKVVLLEIVAVALPILLVKTDEETIKFINQLIEVDSIELNDRFGSFDV